MLRHSVLFLLIVASYIHTSDARKNESTDIAETVKKWAVQISNQLTALHQLARKEKVRESFENTDVRGEDWNMVIENVSVNIMEMMQEKVDAVKAIKKHAEILSMHRKAPINMYSSYDYYDANNLTNTTDYEDRSEDRLETERMWKCSIPENADVDYKKGRYQSDEPFFGPFERYPPEEGYETADESYDSFNYRRDTNKMIHDNNRSWDKCVNIAFLNRSDVYYRLMFMKYNPHFDEKVNLDYSIIRVTPTEHARDPDVLNDIRWSEALDLTFKHNFERDPTLTYQYFGSAKGFVRFYPAMQWSEEKYDQTFEFRIRSWYLESMSSAKDIIILLDRSGSMKGSKRLMATTIVNDILDTLTDNDYVNIYTFTNTTESLVDCFNDTLVQANEENLRLLRERLVDIKDEFYGDISLGLAKAFPILQKYREARRGALVCNQAIMLITEGLDYPYDDKYFKIFNRVENEKYYRPIRVFTYLIGIEPTDAQRMKWIACANMGYFVNITVIDEVREKVLKYLEVMSRPINLSPEVEPNPAWTALYVHLGDRRLSNWLWKKKEGLRQREIYIAYGKELMAKMNQTLKPNQKHYTNTTDHPYTRYINLPDNKFLTSVSLPVYDRRPNQTTLLGVAGVDVPLNYIKQLTEPHRIGVNGYAFIITNNGYVLHHPDHRTEIKDKILKPTFNRVDFTEVEISDDTIEPRNFDKDIIELRENLVLQKKGSRSLSVRTPIEDMRRVIISKRHYFYTRIGPFSLGIALPDRYGFQVIMHRDEKINIKEKKEMHMKMNRTRLWRVHPKWMYTCKTRRAHISPEEELLSYLQRDKEVRNCNTSLVYALLMDVKVTEWFNSEINKNRAGPLVDGVVLTFMATHAGLTRWKDLRKLRNTKHFADTTNSAGDEVYYRRSAELNYDKPDIYIYSLPFEPYDERTTLVTVSNVVFHTKNKKKAPVAAVGFQILHKAMNNLLKDLPPTSKNWNYPLSCVKGPWNCYILDSDGYIILANDTKYLSKSISVVDKILTKLLVEDGVYEEITLYDYQGTCYQNVAIKEDDYYGPTAGDIRLKKEIKCVTEVQCNTIEFLRRQIQKTIPTPCDIELKMYNSHWKSYSTLDSPKNTLDCNCPYVAEPLEHTNLMLIVVNGTCCTEETFDVDTDYPSQIFYNLTLPCHIAVMNNFTKRHYMKCIIKNEKEYLINMDNNNCGGEGIVPIE